MYGTLTLEYSAISAMQIGRREQLSDGSNRQFGTTPSVHCHQLHAHTHTGTMLTAEPSLEGKATPLPVPPAVERNGPKKPLMTQFIYSPQYPRIGPYQRAFGVFGAAKSVSSSPKVLSYLLISQDTIQAVQKGFPDLAQIETNRVDFHVHDGMGNWVRVMDEAWESLGERGAPYCKITVKDGPGDEEKREFIIHLPAFCCQHWAGRL